MRRHLLVTNDFPPKIGGIQSYLWELWRRLPPDSAVVHTTPYPGADTFDMEQRFTITRSRESVLLPTPMVARRVKRLATEHEAELVLWDPALPVGYASQRLDRPYGVVIHGAEVTVPGRLPVGRQLLQRVLRGASIVVCAGHYPAAEAERAAGCSLPTVIIPPGVDTNRFRPLDPAERASVRRELHLPVDAPLVVSVSRLVPRKGMDTLVRAAIQLQLKVPDVVVAIAGSGRDRARLENLVASTGAPVRLLGRVSDELLPGLYGAGDVFSMLCRNRWGGLEQEGFGIVFMEAAASGVPVVAGDSGGSAEAVAEGSTGVVMRRADTPSQVADALAGLLGDEPRRLEMGRSARERAEAEFSYDVLAARLRSGLEGADLRI
ncbi:MAG: glycosyltransferase family 4 protein [Acidimicrobiales bacterium]|nr:glycosyltransferase family 4 protein [Acidimicrobiales bacterium]